MFEHKTILLVDDSSDDAESVQMALKSAGVTNPVFVVSDGDLAIAYLKGEGRFASREAFPMAGVLLLDLSMPRVSGFEVLEWVRKQSGLRQLLVVVLSGHTGVFEVKRAYALGANSFLFKPTSHTEIRHLVDSFQGYWLHTPAPAKANTAPAKSDPSLTIPFLLQKESGTQERAD